MIAVLSEAKRIVEMYPSASIPISEIEATIVQLAVRRKLTVAFG